MLSNSRFMYTLYLKWWIQKLRYKLNADYIESNFVNKEIVRIACKSKIGLFDKNKNKVLLSSSYSNIEKFDNEHLQISKATRKVYIVLPIVRLYSSIVRFNCSIFKFSNIGNYTRNGASL